MRKWVLEVFDDFVYGTTTVYSSTKWNKQLAEVDRLVVQAVADQSAGISPSLRVDLEHSNDQLRWAIKSSPITGSIPAGATTSLFGAESGATPTAGFARLAITLTTALNAHVKIAVCGRDDAP